MKYLYMSILHIYIYSTFSWTTFWTTFFSSHSFMTKQKGAFDGDGDGKMSFPEFCQLHAKYPVRNF